MDVIQINIDNPNVEFNIDGQNMAKWKYFDLEQVIDDAFSKSSADKSIDATVIIRDWMVANGLPSTVNLVTVDRWLTSYMDAVSAEAKKTTGQ